MCAVSSGGWGPVFLKGVEAAWRARLEGGARYDLLLFDDEMPGVRGLELTRRARGLPHRRRTPVVLVSAAEIGAEARGAGADAFLRKPCGVLGVASTVARLLALSDR